MIRKLILIVMLFLSIVIMSMPLSAGERRRGVRGGSGSGLGSLIVELGSAITGRSSDFTPALQSHGILSLKVATKGAEMYVDGRFIGLTVDFKGPAVISVPSGDHVIEFRHNDLSYKTNAHIISGRTTSLIYTFRTNEG